MIETYLDNSTLSSDTEVILLLCGRFGSNYSDKYEPLTQKEYETLTRWLLERKLRPADMLNLEAVKLSELIQVKLDSERVKNLLLRGTALAFALEKWHRSGLWVLSRSDSTYPRRLKKVLGQSAPPLLYGAGDPKLLDFGGVAIIGSRDVDDSGLRFTADLANASVRDNMGIISGGAKGVDAAAMQAGGEAGGVVIGVLASDLLKLSVVRQNRQAIQSGQLVLVSPFNPEAGFNVGNAMARNRYIYALADYAVVVDSNEGKGGTWAGALENLRYKWTPMYVRNSIEKSGNNALIAKGGMKFNYIFSNDASLNNYFNNQTSAVSNLDLLQENTQQFNPFQEHQSLFNSDSEFVIENVSQSHTESQLVPSYLGMFDVFIERLSNFLSSGPKSEEDIRVALGLEKSQVKIWLHLALSKGILEKSKKPITYSLLRQTSLYLDLSEN